MDKRDYQKYLQSAHWQKVKARYAQNHNRECYICGESYNLHLHHKSYERLGKEEPTDLVYLCPDCHKAVHFLADEKQSHLWDIIDALRREKEQIKEVERTRKTKSRRKKRAKKKSKKKRTKPKKKKQKKGLFKIFR